MPDFTNFAEQYASIQPWLQTKKAKETEGEILQTQVKRTSSRRASVCRAAP